MLRRSVHGNVGSPSDCGVRLRYFQRRYSLRRTEGKVSTPSLCGVIFSLFDRT